MIWKRVIWKRTRSRLSILKICVKTSLLNPDTRVLRGTRICIGHDCKLARAFINIYRNWSIRDSGVVQRRPRPAPPPPLRGALIFCFMDTARECGNFDPAGQAELLEAVAYVFPSLLPKLDDVRNACERVGRSVGRLHGRVLSVSIALGRRLGAGVTPSRGISKSIGTFPRCLSPVQRRRRRNSSCCWRAVRRRIATEGIVDRRAWRIIQNRTGESRGISQFFFVFSGYLQIY